MLGEGFYWIFNMSITASVAGLVVLGVRAIPRIPRRVVYFLWIVPFLRMVLPFGLNSPYSLLSLLSRFTTKTVTVFQPGEHMAFSMVNSVQAANSYFPITYRVKPLEQVFAAAAVVWIVVFGGILLTVCVSYAAAMGEIRDATHLRENIYLSGKVQSPAVYGIFRPRIVLPKSYAGKPMDYVLAHERMHIRRRDNLWRAAALVIAAMHWFNPLAWLFLKRFLADMELACDERVISRYDGAQRKEYARALLACQDTAALFTSPFGGAKIRARVENILSFRKMTGLSAVGFFALLAAIFWMLLTNAG